jgi:hypothetical protein
MKYSRFYPLFRAKLHEKNVMLLMFVEFEWLNCGTEREKDLNSDDAIKHGKCSRPLEILIVH